jgi:hypothetical protein
MKNNLQNFLILSLCNIIFLSCDKNELPKFNELNSVRVIAMTTPTPEVNPTDVVTVTPVISDINSTVALTDSVQTCVDLGVAYGLTPTCEGNPTKVVIHTNRILTLPGLGSNWTGNANPFVVNIPSALTMFSGRSAAEQFNGVNYLVEYILKNSSGTEIKSFRRIVVSTKALKNTNPTMTDVFSNGVTMTTLPLGSKVNLSSDLTSVSSENYQVQDFNNTVTTANELLSVTWMITDGKTKFFRSDVGQANEYTGPDAAPTGRSAYVFAVARDNRGGVTVLKRQF